MGPMVSEYQNQSANNKKDKNSKASPFYGYYFKILTSQGPASPGGAYNYIINGRMVAGFALIAFPANYNSTGVMTFIVNQNGKVYSKDLGNDTTNIIKNMTQFNPDKTWTIEK
jgi:hypothetical protein